MTVAAVAAAREAPARRARRRPVRRTVELQRSGVNAPTQAKQYFAVLVEFMEYKNSCSYSTDRGEFTFEELNSIKPEHLYAWMADKCFGTPTPGPDDVPRHARSSSLEYYKKAISYFMPNRGPKWTVTGPNGGEGFGNPTKSDAINDLIRAVKRKETRGVGVKTTADRAFTREEFIQAIDLIQHLPSTRRMDNLRHQAMMKFQNCMIGRADDTAHAKKDGLKASIQFPEYLTAKLRWCKNVHEERDCPDQIILGSMNPKICPVLGLAMFLERWCSGAGRNSQWLFAEGITCNLDFIELQDKEAIKKCKNAYSTALSKVLKSESFVRSQATGKLGTHSIRKYATTTCRSRGATKDETDYRARWKSKRMQDRYTDMQLDWPDIKAATKLCDRGTCVYRVKEGIGITNQWLAMNICPNIHTSFNQEVATILAKALVWACFDPSIDTVPAGIRNEIITKINALIGEEQSADNPIEKLEVIASEQDGTISLDVIRADEGDVELVDEEGNPVGAATAVGRMSTQWRAAIYAKVSSTATRVTNIEQVTIAKFASLEKENKQLKDMLRTLMIAPARIIHPGTANRNRPDVAVRYDGQGAATSPPATLHKNIQTLELLWDEWENGIGGNKPARDFTDRERGANKYAYCRRLGFWTCMERLIRRGCTVPTGIARIKRIYTGAEYNTMTKLLRGIKKDEKNGGHHQLR